MNVEILARIQFAFTVAFHYIFPPLSIGLGLILVIMEGSYLKTKNELYKQMTHFWVKIFALIFGIGVASGIVLEFQFGTNWATYSRYVGDIFGSALAAEGVFAFFLESGFLAILVFGWNRVSPKVHFLATIMVCLGSTFSAVWIIVANSWMQTPAGYKIVGEGMSARAEITDFWAMVFNPSSVDRLSHTVSAAWITGAFLVMSVSAYYLLRNRHVEMSKASMKIGICVALVASILQLATGHKSAIGVAENQPSKFAAMEGHFDSSKPAGLTLFGYVDVENNRVVGPHIPNVGSWLLFGDATKPVKGMDQIPPKDRPPVQATFQFFHLMVAIGFSLIGICVLSVWGWWRGTLWTNKWLLSILAWSVLLPQIANQSGWFAAEIGRQPWIVFNLLRTSEALSKAVKANQVLASLLLFVFIYGLLFALFIYLMDRKIKQGPEDDHDVSDDDLSLDHGAQRTLQGGTA